MEWTAIINLILTVGLPAAEKLWQLASKASVPTQADWDAIKAAAKETAADKMKAQLIAAGISPDSEQGKAMLALAS